MGTAFGLEPSIDAGVLTFSFLGDPDTSYNKLFVISSLIKKTKEENKYFVNSTKYALWYGLKKKKKRINILSITQNMHFDMDTYCFKNEERLRKVLCLYGQVGLTVNEINESF